MRTITLEEHLSFPEITKIIPKDILDTHSLSGMPPHIAINLADITGQRLKSMDENGITMQVLSVSGAGADLLDEQHGPPFAKIYNDEVARQIAPHPTRFAAFAHLPTTAPDAAANELERTVKTHGFKGALINGMTQDLFLDDPKFAPILQRAVQLDVPIYLHPALPPKAVADVYYSGLPKLGGAMLSIAGWGWHSETALHVLRLIVSGTFDKYPKLKLIIGHMGEMLPMMMVRCDNIFRVNGPGVNQRSVIETLRSQVHITTSGLFTAPPLITAIDTFGIDNIMFSIDYPYSTNEQGRQFLKSLTLSGTDIEKLTHINADKLLRLA